MTPEISTGWPAKKLPVERARRGDHDVAGGRLPVVRRGASRGPGRGRANARLADHRARTIFRCGVSARVPRTVTMASFVAQQRAQIVGAKQRRCGWQDSSSRPARATARSASGRNFSRTRAGTRTAKAKRQTARRAAAGKFRPATGRGCNWKRRRRADVSWRPLPVFSPAAKKPQRQQTGRAAGGVNKHVRNQRRSRWAQTIGEIRRWPHKADDKQQHQPGFAASSTGAGIIFHRSGALARQSSSASTAYSVRCAHLRSNAMEDVDRVPGTGAETASATAVRQDARGMVVGMRVARRR